MLPKKQPLQNLTKSFRKLSKREYGKVKKHPTYGYKILKQAGIDESIAQIVLQHHERIDGRGYPEKLRGRQINLESQIVGLADAYEALTHDRPYRGKFPSNEAMQTMLKLKDVGFDNHLIKALLASIAFYPIGSGVQLSNGESGRVIGINKKNPLSPVVEITLDARGNRLTQPRTVDLSQETSITVNQPVDLEKAEEQSRP